MVCINMLDRERADFDLTLDSLKATFGGHVVRRYEQSGERRVDLELACTREGGGVAAQAWATSCPRCVGVSGLASAIATEFARLHHFAPRGRSGWPARDVQLVSDCEPVA